jgi:hypothetical protein
MPSPGQELASIDFASMLGGPLIACINAQSQAALTSINFIKSVGFKPGADNQDPMAPETSDPVYVTFKYPKEVQAFQPAVPAANGNPATPAVPAVYETQQLQVPILTMLPVPYLRLDDVTIDFNAKINAMEFQKVDDSLKIDSKLEVSQGWLTGSAKLQVSVAYQRTSQQGSKVERTYSMAVHIHAVQDEMPAGLEKVLGILEDAIKAQPA